MPSRTRLHRSRSSSRSRSTCSQASAKLKRKKERSMRLWLARHGYAGTRLSDDKLDKPRRLASEGINATDAIAEYLSKVENKLPKKVFASDYARAAETGQIFADWFGCKM